MSPVLLMEKDTVEVVVNPVAGFVPGRQRGGRSVRGARPTTILRASTSRAIAGSCITRAVPTRRRRKALSKSSPRPYSERAIRGILDGMAANG